MTRKQFSQGAFRDYIRQLLKAKKTIKDMVRLTGKTEGTLKWYIKSIKEEKEDDSV